MTGWIKMGTGLRDHPKVVRMAFMLKADCLKVVGALHAVWSVFDEHSPDGLLEFYTLRVMDDKIGWKGFSRAMAEVGWLIETESGLEAPDYEEHNGPSAKRRALDTKRKSESRETDKSANGSWNASGQMSAFDAETVSASDADRTRTRVRVDKSNTPVVPKGGRVHAFPPGFEKLWDVYPRKVAKDAAAKAFAKRKPDAALVEVMVAAVKRQTRSEQWLRDGGQFIPHLSTWLNQGRWMDDVDGSSRPGDDIFAGAR